MCPNATQQPVTSIACGIQHQEPAESRLAVQEYVAIRQASLAKSFPASAAAVADAAVEEDAEAGEEAAGNHDDHEQSAGECASASKADLASYMLNSLWPVCLPGRCQTRGKTFRVRCCLCMQGWQCPKIP